MAWQGPVMLARGFRFEPTPLEAATHYLPRLIAGVPLHEDVRPVIHHADVYACEPGELARRFCPLPETAGHRFFFSPCKLLRRPHKEGKKKARAARAAGPGSWHSQRAEDILDHDHAKVGEIRRLRYKKGGEYTDWLMDECSCCLEEAVVGDTQFVFCKIYLSPRAPEDSEARQESEAFFAPPAPAPVGIAEAGAPKKPEPEVAVSPCSPKRMMAAAPTTTTLPVVQPAAGCSTSIAPPQPCALQDVDLGEILELLGDFDVDGFLKSLQATSCAEGSTVTHDELKRVGD